MTKAKLAPAREDTYVHILQRVTEGDFFVKDGKMYRTYERIGRGPKRRLTDPIEVGNRDLRGYIKFTFSFQGKTCSVMVHRIIYAVENKLSSIDPNLVINHINGIKDDNRLENLELISQKENIAHSLDEGLKCIENNNTTKLSWKKVDRIRELLAEGNLNDREIGDIYTVSKCTIRKIRIGKTWIRGRDSYEKRKATICKGLA